MANEGQVRSDQHRRQQQPARLSSSRPMLCDLIQSCRREAISDIGRPTVSSSYPFEQLEAAFRVSPLSLPFCQIPSQPFELPPVSRQWPSIGLVSASWSRVGTCPEVGTDWLLINEVTISIVTSDTLWKGEWTNRNTTLCERIERNRVYRTNVNCTRLVNGTGSRCHHSVVKCRCPQTPGISRLRTGLSIKSTGSELIDRGRNLHPLVQNSPLPLDTNVSRPFHESSQVSLGLDVLSNSEIPRPLLDQRVHLLDWSLLRLLLLDGRWKLGDSLLHLNLLCDNLFDERVTISTINQQSKYKTWPAIKDHFQPQQTVPPVRKVSRNLANNVPWYLLE